MKEEMRNIKEMRQKMQHYHLLIANAVNLVTSLK